MSKMNQCVLIEKGTFKFANSVTALFKLSLSHSLQTEIVSLFNISNLALIKNISFLGTKNDIHSV
jgi:hypothetical protein